jgi:hypothetical protein
MKKILFVLALFCGFAHAQTVSTFTTETCNVQLSQCTLGDDAGNTVNLSGAFVYSGAVAVNIIGENAMAQPTMSCTANTVMMSQTLYKIISDLTITCGDGSTIEGTVTKSRSGSGRGGWAWHTHVFFDTMTLY